MSNTIITCCCLANVWFMLSRCIKIKSIKNKTLQKLDDLSIRRYVFVSFSFSFSLNLLIYFQHSFRSINFIKIAFSDIFYLVASFILDVLLYCFIGKNETKNIFFAGSSTTRSRHMTFREQIGLARKRRQRILSSGKILIINSIGFFLFKSPFISFSLLGF